MNAAKLFLATDGKAILGDIPVELIVRDDGGANPDTAKRLVQELVTRDRVQYLGGFVFTPNANAVAPLLNQAKVPFVLFNAAGVNTVRLSPWFIRTAFTLWQVCLPLGQWAGGTRKFKTAYTLVTDFGPAWTRRPGSPRGSPTPAARLSSRSRCRCRTRTSSRSCCGPRMPSRTPCSVSTRAAC